MEFKKWARLDYARPESEKPSEFFIAAEERLFPVDVLKERLIEQVKSKHNYEIKDPENIRVSHLEMPNI